MSFIAEFFRIARSWLRECCRPNRSTSPFKIATKRLKSLDSRFSITHRQELISGFYQASLTNAVVPIFGAGGLGGQVAAGFCRKGVGRLRIFDHDWVEASNLNRQHFFKEDVGENKARCLARNLAPHCYAGTILEGHPLSFQDALAMQIDLSGTFAVCGVDNTETRLLVSEYYRRLCIPVIFIAVDLLAECGHIFVQESSATSACFRCAFPNAQAGSKAPCFAPASVDILKITAGLALYAADSLLMDRKRAWNFRRIHLAGFAPDVACVIPKNECCRLCGNDHTHPEQ